MLIPISLAIPERVPRAPNAHICVSRMRLGCTQAALTSADSTQHDPRLWAPKCHSTVMVEDSPHESRCCLPA